MLGFERPNEPVKEPFASEIRAKLYRMRTKQYNDEDIQQMKRFKEISSKYHATWIDK